MSISQNNIFKIDIDNFSGPLDLLLDLAKSQKVDLANISITQLADQFIDYIANVKKQNLDLASEFLLMATWLAYLKSKLLLPDMDEDDFKASEVAEKLKIQLRKLELIRLFSDQLHKKPRIGFDIRLRGMKGGIRLKSNSVYNVSLYELLKSYSSHVMKKNFLTVNIPKLPVCTTEQAIDVIKSNFDKIQDWKEFSELIPKKFKINKRLKKTGMAGFFSASLELTKEGLISIMQKEKFEKLLIKERK
ncbi:MAG: segregation and condensation protein A [Pelagibacterales bacterium]|jgi:segregation and condensation protein A|nr:segregation and condensation protein A [Pelagibacterales bacterium]